MSMLEERKRRVCVFGFKKLRTFAGRTFNVSTWMATDALVNGARNIRQLYGQISSSSRDGRQESFAEAVERLGLSERDVRAKQKYYRKTSALYGVFWAASVMYTLVLYAAGQWLTCLTAVAYSFLVFSFFFREHFWYMQIRQRQFGMHFSDWLKFVSVGL